MSARWLALFSIFKGVIGFHPFAGVEELKPQRIDAFCEQPASGSGLRWCQHSFRKRLEDGGEVEHSWRMHVDPDSILSLDTEAEHGVKVLKCNPGQLELELPDSHARHAAPGQMVVGSRFVHGCEHLPDRHLYSRVMKVQQLHARAVKPWQPRVQRVTIATEELPNLAHVVPFLTFSFSYMPEEARNVVPDPEMVTDYGLNREFLKSRGRKLTDSPPSPMQVLKDIAHEVDGVEVDDGGFKHGGSSGGSLNTQNGILNFVPKQVSNFGWNWDFFMNTTEAPSFNITVPGARGVLKLQKPYIKIHSGIFLNFTSLFEGLTKVPKVKWTAGLKGHGHLQARIQGALNTTGSASVNPFHEFDIDMIDKLKTPQWFEKFEFSAGHMPVSFQPGFQFAAKIYHAGTFHGALVFGINTHGMLNPTLSFDSLKGLDFSVKGDLLNTSIIPPFWMIFTKRFEMGVQLMPALLMKGDFSEEEKATVGVEFRPYLNFSVSRAGEGDYGGEEMKTLTVYPFRVMGLKDENLEKRYKVKIQVLDHEIESTPRPNWGEVHFHDHIAKFSVGQIPEKAVMKTPIKVTLIEVDKHPMQLDTEKTLGVGTLKCSSLLNGECHPAPPLAIIKDGMIEVAAVEFAVLWNDDPRPWFASKIRGLTVTFPQVVLRQDAIDDKDTELFVHLVHGGFTYTVPIAGDIKTQTTALHGTTAIEFGPTFLESWLPCPVGVNANSCVSPRLELYSGSQASAIAVANLPQLDWTSQTAMQGTRGGPFSSVGTALNVPADVALYKIGTGPGTGAPPVAVVKMNTKVLDMPSSSLFFQPKTGTQVHLHTSQEFVWLVAEVDEDQVYGFQLTPYKLITPQGLDMQKYAENEKVQEKKVLVKVGESKTTTMKCSRVARAGIPADEAPCSFAYNLSIDTGFTDGDQAVVRVQWTKNGMVHETWSPPFEVTFVAHRRLKGNQKPLASVPHRQLAAPEADQHPCQAKDLHFQVGVGMMVRGWVDHVDLPQGFPLLGGLDESPEISTGLRKIASTQPGADAKDVFPKDLCKVSDGTMCQAVLPGCTAMAAKTSYFPKLVLNHNRPFHYNQSSKSKFYILMKEALAYAFSTLPEVVDILIKELNETQTRAEHDKKHPTTESGSNPHNDAMQKEMKNPFSDFHHWFNTGGRHRRLHDGAPAAGSPDEADVEEGGQVAMHFREGLPFRLTHPLVATMLKNYHVEVEDDATETLGPLRITSFFLDENISHDISNLRAGPGHGVGAELRRFSPSNAVILLAMACATVLAVAALSMASHRKPWQLKVASLYRAHPSSDSDDSAQE